MAIKVKGLVVVDDTRNISNANTVTASGGLNLTALTTEASAIEVGTGRSGDGVSRIDFVSDSTYTDYGGRLIKTAGPNGTFDLTSRGTGGIRFINTEAATFDWTISGTTEMRLETDGDLHANGDVVAYSTTVSDIQLKDDITTIENGLDKVCALRGVEYNWNKGARKGQRDVGVIAQEVEQVLPLLVRDKKMSLIDGEVYKTVDYEKLCAVLIEAVKELQIRVTELENGSAQQWTNHIG